MMIATVTVLCALVGLVGGIAIAWWPTSTPKIRVASALRPNDERKMFVLSVWNDGRGVAHPLARLRWLKSEDGQDHSGFVPRDLPWIDVVTGLSHGDEGRVVVLIVDREAKVLKFPGVDHRWVKMFTPEEQPLGASFCVRITLPDSDWFADRIFHVMPDPKAPLELRVETSR